MDVVADRKWITDSLRRALQALAAPGDVALSQLPVGYARADELALDYDNFFRAFVGNFGAELSASQLSALKDVDAMLDGMSGRAAHLWTDEAVRSHDSWAGVRAAAGAALDSLGWPVA